jgi:hypothetical protein
MGLLNLWGAASAVGLLAACGLAQSLDERGVYALLFASCTATGIWLVTAPGRSGATSPSRVTPPTTRRVDGELTEGFESGRRTAKPCGRLLRGWTRQGSRSDEAGADGVGWGATVIPRGVLAAQVADHGE